MTAPAPAQTEPFRPLEPAATPGPAALAAAPPSRAPLVRDLRDGTHLVTFVWRGAADRVLVLVNTVSEGHRDDLAPILLERVPGSDVWHRTFRCPSDLRATYQFHPCDGPLDATDDAAWANVRRSAVPDPLNPDRLPSWIPGAVTSLLELPGAPPQPWRDPRPGVPAGALTTATAPSAALGGDRTVHVYAPPVADGPLDLLVLLDGELWADLVPIAPTLDNLQAAGLIRPTLALLPVSGDATVRDAQLGGDAFARFVGGELPAWAADRYDLAGPARRTAAGQSLGGLAAATAALRVPGAFGTVVAQSAALWADGEALTAAYAAAPRVPTRFRLQIGTHEWRLRPAVRRFHAALRERGYDTALTEYTGGHDLACWRGGLADALGGP
ncbi:alpha/beta hydrolase [Actinomadura atramentaria]|uniref:alpha/beta hydrolase n=1 Tax=Actinomadura atramentaria TaxID=1990 RepID=UPI000367E951|nr:alpha/beta hydrolase-fold protein [Actinomadura atramentaria]